ncbi:MAG: hypothetical protein QXD09_05515 [Candidatus Caldarchaeum sp.]
MSLKKSVARDKICPIMSIALKKSAYCLLDKCILWSETHNPEYGYCELKEFLKRK